MKTVSFLFVILAANSTARADESLDEAYQLLALGHVTEATAIEPSGSPGWERLKTRLILDSFANEGALAKDPNVADALSPGAFTKPDKKCYGLVDLSAGYTTNAQTLQGMAPGSGADESTLAKLNADCLLKSNATLALRIDYQGSATIFGQTHKSNYIFHDVTLPLALYRDQFRVRVVPEAYTDAYGGDNFSNDYGMSVDVARAIETVYVSLGVTRMQTQNVTTKFKAFSGYQQRAQLSLQRKWDAIAGFINGYLGTVGNQDTPTEKAANQVRGANFGVRVDHQPWNLTAAAAIERQTYNQAETDVRARLDTKLMLDIQAGWRMSDSTRFYVEANRTESKSNLNQPEDHYFRQFQIYAGVVAAF